MSAVLKMPARPEDVSPAWLSAALSTIGDPVAVSAVTITPVGTGQTGATYRVVASYDEDPGLPTTFIVKLPSQEDAVRERVALSYRSEHAFYTSVADTVAVPLAQCFYCEVSDDGGDFVLLLSDLAPAVQGDQIKGGTVAECRLAVEALAGLHGPRWCDPDWLTLAGTVMPKPDADSARGLADIAGIAVGVTVEKLGDRMSEANRVTLAESAALIGDWLMLEPERFSLLHGDYRLDNLLFDAERTRVTVVDWQTLTVGLPARDLAYFVATSLLPAVRAEAERDLVDAYHEALLTYGVTDYDAAACWRDYRLGMLQVPLITTLGFAFSAATDRGDDMALAMLERGCRAIRELGTLELIRESA